jgi:hypothetical protein
MSQIPAAVAPSSRSWLGIGREITTGTPVSPSNAIPLDKSSYEPEDMIKYLEDLAIRGYMSHRYADVEGVTDASFSYGSPYFGDVWGYFFDNLFGDMSTVGSNGTSSTTTTQALTAGATSGSVSALTGYTNSSIVQIGTGSIAEVVILNASGGTIGSSINFTSYPLRFAHANGAAVQVVSGPYTHTFAVLNQTAGYGGIPGAQPPTHTVTDTTYLTPTVNARAYPSLVVGQLDISGNAEGLLMAKVSGNSWLSAPAGTAPVNTTTFTPPLAAWNSTITVGGTAVYSNGEWAVSMKRELGIYWTAQGAQNPYTLARGDLDATGSQKYSVASDESGLNLFLNNTQPSLSISVTNGGTGTGLIQLVLSTHGADYVKSKPTRSGVLIGYDNDWRTHANTSDVGGSGGLGQMTAVLTNNVPTY